MYGKKEAATKIGISPSSLSQIKNDRRPASQKVLSKLNTKMLSKPVR